MKFNLQMHINIRTYLFFSRLQQRISCRICSIHLRPAQQRQRDWGQWTRHTSLDCRAKCGRHSVLMQRSVSGEVAVMILS